MWGRTVEQTRRNGHHAENVVDLARFRGSRIAPAVPPSPPSTSPSGPYITVERDAAGRLTYEYDVEPADVKSVMSICLMIIAKLLSRLPTAA